MPKTIETPQGPVEFPDTMGDAEITAVLRKQFPAPEQPSLMRRAANLNFGRDLIAPVVSKGLEVVGQGMSGIIPPDEEARQAQVAGNKAGADTLANMAVPQNAAQAAMLVAPVPGQGAFQGSHRLLKAALARMGLQTGAGAAGGAADAPSVAEIPGSMAKGAGEGLVSGALGEGAGYLGGKLARSGPGAARSIAGSDQRRLVAEAQKAVPLFRGVPGVDLDTPAGLMKATKENQLGSALSEMTEQAGQQIDRRIRGTKINVPELSDKPLSTQEAWRGISEVGQQGYGGTKENPTLRVMTGLQEREARERALDQVFKELQRLDPSGSASKIFHEARQTYSTGLAYVDKFKDAWTNQGRAHLDVPKVQKETAAERGALRHVTAEGEIAGGKMASPDRVVQGPTEPAAFEAMYPWQESKTPLALPPIGGTSPAAPMAAGPTSGRRQQLWEGRVAPQAEGRPRIRVGAPGTEPTIVGHTYPPPTEGATHVLPQDIREGIEGISHAQPTRFSKQRVADPTAPGSPDLVITAPTPAPPTTLKGRDDFEPFAKALHRGGGLDEFDYDWISNLGGASPGLGMRGAQFLMRGLGLLPNVGKVYAGQAPRVIPPGVQQGANYELLKWLQNLTGNSAGPPPR